MTATRHPLGLPSAPPYDSLAIGQTASGTHATSLAWLANEAIMVGGTLFHLNQPGDADTTPATIRVKAPLRRGALARLWVVGYQSPQIAGRLILTPGVAPLNAADEQWAEGLFVEPKPAERRACRPLMYFERVDSGSYTNPDTDADVTFSLTWPGSGSTALTIDYVACYELPRNRETEDDYGVDPEPLAARRAIMSAGTSTAVAAGVRQLVDITQNAAFANNRRALFHWWSPTGVAFNSAIYSALHGDILPRIHPRRLYRLDPGWSYTPTTSHGAVEIWYYGQNSAETTGVIRVKSEKDTTGVLSTSVANFPVAPSAAGWVGPVRIACYCESCFATAPSFDASPLASAVPSVRGFLTNASATSDCDAEGVTRAASAWEETLTFEGRGIPVGEAPPNTVTLYGISVIQV